MGNLTLQGKHPEEETIEKDNTLLRDEGGGANALLQMHPKDQDGKELEPGGVDGGAVGERQRRVVGSGLDDTHHTDLDDMNTEAERGLQFDDVDLNHDGCIDRGEWEAVFGGEATQPDMAGQSDRDARGDMVGVRHVALEEEVVEGTGKARVTKNKGSHEVKPNVHPKRDP